MSNIKKNFSWVGPILRKTVDDYDLYVYSIGFNDKEMAQSSKDMNIWIIKDGKVKPYVRCDVFDKQEYRDDYL